MTSNSPTRDFEGGSPMQLPSMYHPAFEHDACGIGCIAHLDGQQTHTLVEDALRMLGNMEHRGATGADPETGDGAGILLQLYDPFFRDLAREIEIELPNEGDYGVGMTFFPKDKDAYTYSKNIIAESAALLGVVILGYRKVPTRGRLAGIGKGARQSEPTIEQVFVKTPSATEPGELERKLYVLRKAISNRLKNDGIKDFHFASFSSKTIIYKGQLTTEQLKVYFSDLHDARFKSALALVHSRFSTNTHPSWALAQPFRYLAHNGEINTHQGNINWLKSKEAILESSFFSSSDWEALKPICQPDFSDSRNLDAVVELLLMAGRPLPHVMMMLMPEAWQNNGEMSGELRSFYEYHAALTEAWDGPAAVCFSDGVQVGAILDRNGLRPARYTLTKDQRFILASEEGALPLHPAMVAERGRLAPGKMLLIDTAQGKFYTDEQIKRKLVAKRPYRQWLEEESLKLEELPPYHNGHFVFKDSLLQRQKLFGMNEEEMRVILKPMALTAKEPLASMGVDTPLAILSSHSQHLSYYFKQLFAQVSNPPIDPIREKNVMSLSTWIGSSKNFLTESKEHCSHISLQTPILTNEELNKVRYFKNKAFSASTIDICFSEGESLENAIGRICGEVAKALEENHNILILSDKKARKDFLPIPALLATGAIHHYLIREGKRHLTALVLETGDAREVHHFATLIGYGAAAINPYLAFESLKSCVGKKGFESKSLKQLSDNYVAALNKGLLKIISKMGISTLQSYHGAQIFEVVGLSQKLVNDCFQGTVSRLGGLGFKGIEREIKQRQKEAFAEEKEPIKKLPNKGNYQWRKDGESHLYNPTSIHLLQKSTKLNDYELYKKYSKVIDEGGSHLRSLLEFTHTNPIPLDQVEPVEGILRRFATGAMSFGSLSYEAHSTLAVAMNRIGGKSNSGEGGEDPDRYPKHPNGDWERSAIKQIASGRFGVTIQYLSEADELQIKIAQGAKPGEGGHLPGYKVNDWIARVRHSTAGVGLISPPPHHDIYSIEDLAQLIFDLKNANPSARISVKLVSKGGVGTIAAGVAKAHADHILISGYDGGTGASPLSSIRHAGLPWEMGLAEAHQTLVRNRLRNRVVLQADGGMRTGRDLAIATLLGAEEWGIATAALVVEGCILMRKCHLNTCPVGIATQNPVLRSRFEGKAEHLVNFFHFMAEELREYMALLGFRTVNEMVGQVDKLQLRQDLGHWKHQKIDLSQLLFKEEKQDLYANQKQDHGIEHILDRDLIEACEDTLKHQIPTRLSMTIGNVCRSTGTMLSHEVIKASEGKGFPDGSIQLTFRGSAGQSFAAFGAKGIRFMLEGEANDYVGKGLSGAELIVYPDREAPGLDGQNIIIGNVGLYGATSGSVFVRGMAGERFAVRNSGANAVVEGVGDHACEYMTGGRVVVLGNIGKNFGAGMSGGLAYIYQPSRDHIFRINTETVSISDPLDEGDKEFLEDMVRLHLKHTQSPLAAILLENWNMALQHFTKVFPKDYKKALQAPKPTSTKKEFDKMIG